MWTLICPGPLSLKPLKTSPCCIKYVIEINLLKLWCEPQSKFFYAELFLKKQITRTIKSKTSWTKLNSWNGCVSTLYLHLRAREAFREDLFSLQLSFFMRSREVLLVIMFFVCCFKLVFCKSRASCNQSWTDLQSCKTQFEKQSPKNLVCVSALLTGMFLRVRKVFAHIYKIGH